jgi:hypothetical protein
MMLEDNSLAYAKGFLIQRGSASDTSESFQVAGICAMGYSGPAVKISHPVAEFLPLQAPIGIIQSRSLNT